MVDKDKLRKFFSYFSIFNRNRDAATVVMIGGIITFIVSIIILTLLLGNSDTSTDEYVLFLIGALIPSLMEIFAAIMMWRREDMSKIMGTVAVLGSILSLIDSEGGLAIGFFLALFGGIMSLFYYPQRKSSGDNIRSTN